jgi:hypothetical protein
MSEFNKFNLGPTPSRVSFSRGLLRYVQEEPVVGRHVDRAAPPNTSTPKDGGMSRDEWWTEKLEKMEKQHREDIEWQSVRIQHLEQLLDGERRMVDTLSKFTEMPKDYQRARVDTHKTNLETMPMDVYSLSMPELVTVDGVREEIGRGKSDKSRTAADVFSGRTGPLKMLVPKPIGERAPMCNPMEFTGLDKSRRKELGKPDDLSWYDEYMQQKIEGKWDKGLEKGRETELKSVLTDQWVESRDGAPGAGACAPRMKPSAYDGLTPYED